MVKIEIYSLVGSTVVTCDVVDHREPQTLGGHTLWTPLAYVGGPIIAHDETGMLADLVREALDVAEPRAAEMGGWGVLI